MRKLFYSLTFVTRLLTNSHAFRNVVVSADWRHGWRAQKKHGGGRKGSRQGHDEPFLRRVALSLRYQATRHVPRTRLTVAKCGSRSKPSHPRATTLCRPQDQQHERHREPLWSLRQTGDTPPTISKTSPALLPTRAPRVFLGGSNLHVNQIITLSPEQTHYLVNVMRLRSGSAVRVFDGVHGEFLAVMGKTEEETGKESHVRARKRKRSSGSSGQDDQAQLSVEHVLRPQPGPRGTDLANEVEIIFAPIRKQRQKVLVEKAVEVGATRLTPVLTARTQKGAAVDVGALCKLGAVTAVEAAEQCERMTVPHVETAVVALTSLLQDRSRSPTSDDSSGSRRSSGVHWVRSASVEAIETNEEGGAFVGTSRAVCPFFSETYPLFVCKERDVDAPPLLDALARYDREMEERIITGFTSVTHSDGGGESADGGRSNADDPRCVSAAFLVGPEGGFDDEEIREMATFSFVRFVSLGPTVLRAETAVVYALSCWNAFWASERSSSSAS